MADIELIPATGQPPAAPHDTHPFTVEKLVVIVPALDEGATIGDVIAAVPRSIRGVRSVEVVLVDDGSTDDTQVRAVAAGVDAITHHPRRRGLVAAFKDGVAEALRRGASIVVTLDGDGQHDPARIPELIAPIVAGSVDIVLGVRSFGDAREMTRVRRHGNAVGASITRRALGLSVRDVTTGYRAFSRDALLRLNVTSRYTYTLETLVEASRKHLTVAEVEVPTIERVAGKSRMTGSVGRYILRTGGQAANSLLREHLVPLFGVAAVLALSVALGCTARFLWGYHVDGAGRHLPSLLAAIIFSVVGTGLFVSRLIADGIETSRRLVEDTLYSVRRLELGDAFQREWSS